MAMCSCGRAIKAKERNRRYCSMACYDSARKQSVIDEAESGMRRCAKCSTTNPLSQFSHGNGSNGRHAWCKPCRAESERARRVVPERLCRHAERYRGDQLYRAEQLVGAAKKRARRVGLAFDLTPEWLADRLRCGRCEVTGIPFSMTVHNGRPGPFSPSIDRIQPCDGYTIANCRVVLMALNLAMNTWGLDPVLAIAEALTVKDRTAAA